MRFRSCCACIAASVFFSIIRFFSSSRCRISSTCTHVTTHTRSSYGQCVTGVGTETIQSALHGRRCCTRRENAINSPAEIGKGAGEGKLCTTQFPAALSFLSPITTSPKVDFPSFNRRASVSLQRSLPLYVIAASTSALANAFTIHVC